MSTSGGYHEYIGGCSVHRRDTMSISGHIMSTSGGYHDACGGTVSTSGDIMSTLGVHRGYIGGCSVHWGFQWKFKVFTNLLPHMHHDVP